MFHFIPQGNNVWDVIEGALHSQKVGEIELFKSELYPLAFFKTNDRDGIPGPTIRDLNKIAAGMKIIEEGRQERFCLDISRGELIWG